MESLKHESFSTFLSTLLGNPSRLQLTAGNPPPASPAVHQKQEAIWNNADVRASLVPGGSCSGASAKTGIKGRETNNSSKGNQGIRLQLLRLEKQLHQQQLKHKLYLTTRVAMLELEFMREGAKPGWFVQRFQHGVQIMAGRLATCTPLVQKYPHLATSRPPAPLLEQLHSELSLAEPTNPYGADGFVTGSLTIPIPDSIIRKLFAAYGLDVGQMHGVTHEMLATFATLVLEQTGCSKACAHSYVVYPSIFTGDAVHLDASACYSSWEDVMSLFEQAAS